MKNAPLVFITAAATLLVVLGGAALATHEVDDKGQGRNWVDSIIAGVGLNGGTIHDDGTIDLQVPVTIAHGGTGAVSAGAALTALGATPSTRLVATMAPLTGGGDLSGNRTLAMHVVDATHDGYLTSSMYLSIRGNCSCLP